MGKKQPEQTEEEIEFESEGDEAWATSYADLISLLLGFFIILYSMADVNDERLEEITKKMAESFTKNDKKSETVITEETTEQDRQVRALKLLVSMLKLGDDVKEVVDKIENAQINEQEAKNAQDVLKEKLGGDVVDKPGKSGTDKNRSEPVLEIVIPYKILFTSGTDSLQKASAGRLKKLGGILAGVEDIAEVEIIGHTDSSPPSRDSGFESNWQLSSARASRVAQFLIENGVSEDRIRTSGMAHVSPLFPERDNMGRPLAANMEKNRRVQIIVKKKKL